MSCFLYTQDEYKQFILDIDTELNDYETAKLKKAENDDDQVELNTDRIDQLIKLRAQYIREYKKLCKSENGHNRRVASKFYGC